MVTDLSAWTAAWRQVTEETQRVSDTQYWDRRAADYDDFIQTSEYAYGEAIAGLLAGQGCLLPTTEVVEIAAGVGAVTLPLARQAARVLAFEPAPGMADRLAANAAAAHITSLDIRREPFAADTLLPSGSFDLALMCHASWQFPDFPTLIDAMTRISRGFCCLADTVGRADADTTALNLRLGLPASATVDRVPYLFNQLYLSGYNPRLAYIPWTMRRSVASATAMWKMVTGKYRTLDARDLQMIEAHVAAHSREGIYETPSLMAVFWWAASPQDD